MPTTSNTPSEPISGSADSSQFPQVSPKGISRRRFARDAAAIAAISMAPSSLLASPHRELSDSPAAPVADDNKSNLTPDQLQEVEAKLANIIRKYGGRLSEEQRLHLRRILTYNQKLLIPIRAFPLKNGDPPVTVMKLCTNKTPRHSSASNSSKERSAS